MVTNINETCSTGRETVLAQVRESNQRGLISTTSNHRNLAILLFFEKSFCPKAPNVQWCEVLRISCSVQWWRQCFFFSNLHCGSVTWLGLEIHLTSRRLWSPVSGSLVPDSPWRCCTHGCRSLGVKTRGSTYRGWAGFLFPFKLYRQEMAQTINSHPSGDPTSPIALGYVFAQISPLGWSIQGHRKRRDQATAEMRWQHIRAWIQTNDNSW